jgi:hypothetical protein
MISVITPSYNQLDWLRLCIASVRDQEGVVLEHLVQDGGSEGAGAFFEGMPREGTGYRLLPVVGPDGGMYDAINRGLLRASGEICAYLNCDEQYLPGALARVAAYFEARPQVELVFADALLVSRDGRPLSYRRAILPDRAHVRSSHLNTLTCSTFFRRSLVEKGFLFDPEWKIIGDAVWVDRLLEAGVVMEVLPHPTSTFAFTGSNMSESRRQAEEQARWRAQLGMRGGLARHFHVARHRVRKLLSGSYLPKVMDVEQFTMDSPARRVVFKDQRLGFGWPRTEKHRG